MLKDEYPKAIADKLGIPPQHGSGGPWMSTEGTVLKLWLVAVGEALDIPYAGEKTKAMKALVEAVGETWNEETMTSRLTSSEGGGNIRLEAFQVLLHGLDTQQVALRRGQSNHGRGPFTPSTQPGRAEDRIALRAIKQRAGQPQFRADVLAAYGAVCALTGCDAPAALEAAHVLPYGSGGTYDVVNGLLLRADIHTLFDLGLLAFDDSRRAVLHTELLESSHYAPLSGARLADPKPQRLRVPDSVLGEHRRKARL